MSPSFRFLLLVPWMVGSTGLAQADPLRDPRWMVSVDVGVLVPLPSHFQTALEAQGMSMAGAGGSVGVRVLRLATSQIRLGGRVGYAYSYATLSREPDGDFPLNTPAPVFGGRIGFHIVDVSGVASFFLQRASGQTGRATLDTELGLALVTMDRQGATETLALPRIGLSTYFGYEDRARFGGRLGIQYIPSGRAGGSPLDPAFMGIYLNFELGALP